jgi:hypothetical protein
MTTGQQGLLSLIDRSGQRLVTGGPRQNCNQQVHVIHNQVPFLDPTLLPLGQRSEHLPELFSELGVRLPFRHFGTNTTSYLQFYLV